MPYGDAEREKDHRETRATIARIKIAIANVQQRIRENEKRGGSTTQFDEHLALRRRELAHYEARLQAKLPELCKTAHPL